MSVCNVPSVGQWDALELQDFLLRDCADKINVIICDADGGENPDVMTQALLYRQRICDTLQTQRVGIFAPPLWAYRQHPELKGQDDWHGLAPSFGLSGRLEDLESLGHEVPSLAFAAWAARRSEKIIDGRRIRSDRVKRELRAMIGLSDLGGPGGETRASLKKIAGFTDLSDDSVEHVIHALIEDGELRIDRPLETARWQRRSKTYWERSRAFVGNTQHRPTISIVNPTLHAIRRPPQRLEDWLRLQAQEGDKVTREQIEQLAKPLERIATALERLTPPRGRAEVDADAATAELAEAIEAWNDEAAA
jgi:hypothetical protein